MRPSRTILVLLALAASGCASADPGLGRTAADPAETGAALPSGSGVLRPGFDPDTLLRPPAGGDDPHAHHHHHHGHAQPAGSAPPAAKPTGHEHHAPPAAKPGGAP